jgi:hypothetical protein
MNTSKTFGGKKKWTTIQQSHVTVEYQHSAPANLLYHLFFKYYIHVHTCIYIYVDVYTWLCESHEDTDE